MIFLLVEVYPRTCSSWFIETRFGKHNTIVINMPSFVRRQSPSQGHVNVGGGARPRTPCNRCLPHNLTISACLWYAKTWMHAVCFNLPVSMCIGPLAYESI